MRVKILGFSGLRSGSYQGHDWTNHHLYAEHVGYVPADVTGSVVEDIKVSANIPFDDIVIGDVYELSFNRFGRVDAIIPVQG